MNASSCTIKDLIHPDGDDEDDGSGGGGGGVGGGGEGRLHWKQQWRRLLVDFI